MMALDCTEHVDASFLGEIRGIREDLHRHPELAYQERRTSRIIADLLRKWDVEILSEGIAGTGLVGILRGGKPGVCVALRSEMDALPIQEENEFPYASENPGVMHACGHDGHMAIVLAAARLLAAHRSEIPGVVKFLFQPAEETDGGAKKMIRAGVLRASPRIKAIFALHARPQILPGQIELDEIPGAASNAFEIRVQGKGTHAAYPHRGTDPIVIGSQIVCALQQVVSRQVAPFHQAVVTVGYFRAGSKGNVIPPEAVMRGTIRTRDPAVRDVVFSSVTRIVEGCAAALGGQAQVKIRSGYPRLHNDAGLMELVREVGTELLGSRNVLLATEATMGAEDFAFYLKEQGGVPGCMFRLGVEAETPVHTSRFDFGHQALEPGILMMTNIALKYLRQREG